MFITLEGGEGAGKTTQIKNICHFLKLKNCEYVVTREPGGTIIGQQIRSILLDPTNSEMDSTTELLLYLADRIQHIKQVIQPAFNIVGKVIVCDRYFDSTFAYQGVARNLKIDLAKLHQMFEVPIPDITFLLDLPAEVGLSRAWLQIDAGNRDKTQTRFEDEKIDFHKKLRLGYLQLAKQESYRFCVIDAQQSEEKVWRDIKKILNMFF